MEENFDLESAIQRESLQKDEKLKLAKAAYSFIDPYGVNPWAPSMVDKLDIKDIDHDTFKEIIEACRFFYKRDPTAGTVIDKMVDIGITDLYISKEDLSENEYRIFSALLPKLKEFAEDMALEYLLSGLVIPEIKFDTVGKEELKKYNIKKYTSMEFPVSLWIRDPATVKINKTILSDKPSYFINIPDDLAFFIKNNGRYPDGTEDPELYKQLVEMYPEFVRKVKSGKKDILLTENVHLIIRRRVISDSGYPVPFLYKSIESMKHKRNLRRMDYSVASRVITAIQLIKLGNDEYPVTEDDEEQFNDIKNQMYWRNSATNTEVEKVFQLFANHTLTIEWVFPETDVLLDEAKYADVNQDIMVGLGFPKILMTGENDRSGAGDSSYAASSPIKTIEHFRNKLISVLQYVINELSERNNLRSTPEISFMPIQLAEFGVFIDAIRELYTSGNLSRESYASLFGFNIKDELLKRSEENKLLKEYKLDDFAPLPHSNAPNSNDPNSKETPAKKPTEKKPVEKTNNTKKVE